jgi:uncharacterized protein
MASEGLHEPADKLYPETVDIHRAIVSLMEELEAYDWYRQRVDACTDPELRAILQHNMDEEVEHASMVLEWIRRHVPKFDESLKTYLFTTGDVTKLEEAITKNDSHEVESPQPKHRTTIGDMKG